MVFIGFYGKFEEMASQLPSLENSAEVGEQIWMKGRG